VVHLAKALMLQGTGSDVGKSLIVAALCRAFTRRGLVVRPFKPQNMSNNAAVTADGGEIGRAQALQARACGVEPSVHMNPVLLKPQSGTGSQIILQGKMIGQAQARDYQAMKQQLLPAVLESFARLKDEADLVIVEGAGSPAEINLRPQDIANMGFARAAGVPVVLIGDIDRGGVIAQIVGTKAVLAEEDAAMIKGFLVNKFRGDPTLFAAGMKLIEQHSGWPSFGLVPYCAAAEHLPAEDSMGLRQRKATSGRCKIVVPVLPGIANFDDFDPLRMEEDVTLDLVPRGRALPGDADLVVLAGSKTTIADLAVLRREGWDVDLVAHIRRGGFVLGICGGYQMLGRTIADPAGIEGAIGAVDGLGWLDIATELTGTKRLAPVAGKSAPAVFGQAAFDGYEMHVGETQGQDCARPLVTFADGRSDGAVSRDGRIMGCYVHGLFAHPEQRKAWLALRGAASSGFSYEERIEGALDALEAHLEAHVDLDRLLSLAR
jgi:adenosylcobyric acid synthase